MVHREAPVRRRLDRAADSPVKKAGIVALGLVVPAGALAVGLWLVNPDEPAVFSELPILNGDVARCANARAYQLDNPDDNIIAGGAGAIFQVSAADPYGLEYYQQHADAVAVGACESYIKKHPNTNEKELFRLAFSVVQAPAEAGAFQLTATVEPTN
jgi:hypothetical protein